MSLEFSRRSFLKYTAVAAVAVAGASMFSGCEQTDSYNLLCTGAGSMTILQVTATMGNYDSSSKKYTTPEVKAGATKIEFPIKIENGRTNPISINPANFKVTVTSADGKTVNKYTGSKLDVSSQLGDTNLKKGSSVSGTITATVSELAEGDVAVLTYCPDLQYNEYSLNWKLTVAAADTTDDNKDTTGGEDSSEES